MPEAASIFKLKKPMELIWFEVQSLSGIHSINTAKHPKVSGVLKGKRGPLWCSDMGSCVSVRGCLARVG